MVDKVAHRSRGVGIDFGTSNSAAAVAEGGGEGRATVLNLDPLGLDPALLRSVLFFPEESRDVCIGAEAVARYAVAEEGRFIQSVKSFLPSTLFSTTTVGRRAYTLPELIAELLTPIRQRVEAFLAAPIDRVVFGRPALFSADPRINALAQERLAQAAQIAGFPAVEFLIEPIAAALRYEQTLTQEELVLVGDFGAGTSDFTLIRLGPNRRGARERQADVLASTGVYVGGDDFDAVLVEHALLPFFGANSSYLNFDKRTDVPTWLVRKLTRWHELAVLRDPKVMGFLYQVQKTSSDPRGINNFVALLEGNLGYRLSQAVEACKRALSHEVAAPLRFVQGDVAVETRVSQAQFEAWMQPLLARLEAAVGQVMENTALADVDAVFLTGGTSQIPAVQRLFANKFGASRLRAADTFTSVVSGLARAAAS